MLACNPSTWQRSRVQDQPGLQGESKVSLNYTRVCFQRGRACEIRNCQRGTAIYLSWSQGSWGLLNPDSKSPGHQQVLLYPDLCLRVCKGLASVGRQREEPLPSVCRDEISASREVEGKIDAVEDRRKSQH